MPSTGSSRLAESASGCTLAVGPQGAAYEGLDRFAESVRVRLADGRCAFDSRRDPRHVDERGFLCGRFSAVQELLNPFNIVNWLVTIITLAPGFGALAWAEKVNAKRALPQ